MVLVLILRLAVAMVIDTSNWKEFRVKDLFPPCKVTKLTKKPQSEGENDYTMIELY